MAVTKSKYTNKVVKFFGSTIGKVIFLIPLILVGYVAGSLILYLGLYGHIYADDVVVSMDEFVESDPETLANAAWQYDQIKSLYNLPYNLTGDGWDYYPYSQAVYQYNPWSYGLYNDTQFVDYMGADLFNPDHVLNQINYYTGQGHAIVYAGFFAMGEACRYATFKREGNSTGLEESKQELLKIAKGFSILSEVSGDGSMARWVVPDTPQGRDLIPSYSFRTDYSGLHLYFPVNYTGPNGKNYTFYCETGTSVDCYLGAYVGFGFMYELCDDPEVRAVIRTAVDRMLEFNINSGWRFMDEDGKSHMMGAEAFNNSPFTDASYVMTFLRVGKTVNPEKWGPIYDEYAYERLDLYKVGKNAQLGYYMVFAWSENGGYFNLNLAVSLAMTICFLEDDPALKKYYQDNYLEPMHDVTKYHRNAWFDVGYYLGMSNPDYSDDDTITEIPDTSRISDSEKEYIEASVADSLMRLSYSKSTFRQYSVIQNTEYMPGAPYPDLEPYVSEDYAILNNTFIQLFGEFYYPGNIWDAAVPSDWLHISEWMWESSPFEIRNGGNSPNQGTCPGSFTAPYWIARYLNFETIAIN